MVTPSATGASGGLAAGIYITLVFPIALPQGLLDEMKKSVTLVERPTGPEVCSYSKKIEGAKGKYAYLNGKRATVKVNGSNPLISLVCSGLKKAPLNLASGFTTKPRHKTKTSLAIGPIGFTAAHLKAQSSFIHTKFYWAGPQQGDTYEFTRTKLGYLFVRYLPAGVRIGAPGANFLIISTYPIPDAYQALHQKAKSRAIPGPGGSIVYVDPLHRNSVYMAWRGVNDEVEVYAPQPAVALATARSGKIKPVR